MPVKAIYVGAPMKLRGTGSSSPRRLKLLLHGRSCAFGGDQDAVTCDNDEDEIHLTERGRGYCSIARDPMQRIVR